MIDFVYKVITKLLSKGFAEVMSNLIGKGNKMKLLTNYLASFLPRSTVIFAKLLGEFVLVLKKVILKLKFYI